MSSVVVIGAGVVGLTAALTLAERGAKVTLVERSRELGGNASWLAGGMLAPFCEGESAPQSVVELGQGAIDWWERAGPRRRARGHAGRRAAARRRRDRPLRCSARADMSASTRRGSPRSSRISPGVSARVCSSPARAISIRAPRCARSRMRSAATAPRCALARTARGSDRRRGSSSIAEASPRGANSSNCAACAAR